MASPKQDPTSHALLLAETLELQQTLVGVHAQLQANVVILSKQVQSGLGAVARVLDILAKEKGAVGSGPEVRDKEREKVENEVILAKGRAAAAIAAAAAVKAMTSTSPSTAPAFDFTSGLKNTSRSISFGEQAPHSQPDRYQYHNDLLDLIRDPLSPPKKNSSALSPSGGMPLSPIPSYHNQQMTFQSVPPQPITKQSSSSAKISMSDHSSAGVQSDSHLSMGLKWESTDYVMASKLEARNQQLSKNSSVFSDSSLGTPSIQSEAVASATVTRSNTQAQRRKSGGLQHPPVQSNTAILSTSNLRNWLSRTFSSQNQVPTRYSSDDLPQYTNEQLNKIWNNPEIQQKPKNRLLTKLMDDKAHTAIPIQPPHHTNSVKKVAPSESETISATAAVIAPTIKVEAAAKKWEQLRNDAIRKSSVAHMDPGFSNVVTAVFPDISKPLSAEQKRERAQNNWRKIRKEVFTQNSQPGGFEIISSLAITALPDLMKLNQKLEVGGPSAATDSRASYKSVKAKLHWFFLCPAFDDKGKWISIHQYHNMEFRKHNFWVDGLNPMSLFSATANLIITIFFFFLLIAVPFQIAYDDTTDKFLDQSHRIMAVFAIDTLLNIVTPLKPPKTDTRKVRRSTLSEWSKRYAKIFLVLDILTMIPWVHLVPLGIDSLLFALVHLLRSVRLPRMLTRIPIWIILHDKIEAVPGFGNHLSFMIPIGVAILLFIHLQSCVLYFAGKQFGFVSWNTQFPHWEAVEGGIQAATTEERYIWMLTQALGNVFQMSFRPETVWEQLITMFFVVFGGLLYAILVGLISSAAFCYDASGRLYRQKIDELSEYLHWKNIDDKTKQKLLSYYEFKYKGKYFEERNLLADMNESLRRELASITCKQLIEKVPFLKREMKDGRDQIYLGKIATALVPIQFIAGDTIVSQGEQATEMYFILHGKVSILVNGNYVTSFADGGFFGEVALIANIPRTATVIAGTNCNLYTLSAKDFNSILLEFDDMKRRIDKIYEERMAKVRLEQAARLFMDRRPSTLQPVTENPNGSNDIH